MSTMVSVGMIFAMIFTLIIIGVLFAVGFNQIQGFFCLGSNAQVTKSVKDIEKLTDEVFVLAKGSSKTYSLTLPSGTRICFINQTSPGPHPYQNTKKTWNPDSLVLEQFLQNPNSPQYHSNTWLYFCGSSLGEGHSVKFLSPSQSFCSAGGTLFLENKGTRVDISALE